MESRSKSDDIAETMIVLKKTMKNRTACTKTDFKTFVYESAVIEERFPQYRSRGSGAMRAMQAKGRLLTFTWQHNVAVSGLSYIWK